MMRNLIKVYLVENKKVENFFKEQDVIKFFRKLFSFKIIISSINLKLKMTILLFAISPKICKKIVKIFS